MRTARKTIALAQKIATRNFQLTVVMSSVIRFPKITAGSEKVPMKVDRPLASTSLMKRNLKSVATNCKFLLTFLRLNKTCHSRVEICKL